MGTKMFQFVVAAMVLLFAMTAAADDLYRAELKGEYAVGQDGRVELVIHPAKGWKWNKDYPAKLTLGDGVRIASFTKTVFKKTKGEITGDDANGKVAIPGKGVTAGTAPLAAKLSFSVCNKETCKLLKEDLKLTLTVK